MPRHLRRAFAALMTTVVLLTAAACSGDDGGDSDSDGGGGSGSAASESAEPGAGDEVAQIIETGIAQAQQGDDRAARVTFNNALTIDPGNKFALYNLGLLSQNKGNVDQALDYYDQALATDPEYTPAMYNKAIAVEPTDLEQAVSIYEQITEINPEASTTFLRLSFAYDDLGQADQAEEARAKAVELDPSLAEVTERPEQ